MSATMEMMIHLLLAPDRFNHAPTLGYEHDVGNRTSLRIINDVVVREEQHNFLDSPLYSSVALLAWEPHPRPKGVNDMNWWGLRVVLLLPPVFHHMYLLLTLKRSSGFYVPNVLY